MHNEKIDFSIASEKELIFYELVDYKLTLTYKIAPSSAEENLAIPSMDDQAKKQKVFSYEQAHQIAERLELSAIYAGGFGDKWASDYNQVVMGDIERLKNEYSTKNFSRC